MPNNISSKTKQELLQRYQDGESVKNLCLKHRIPRSTFYYWIKLNRIQITKTGVIVTPKQFDTLSRKLKKYQSIVEILKKADCTTSSPLRKKLQALEPLYGKYNVRWLCEALDVSRGSFYNHVLRNKRENAWFKKRREDLRVAVQAVYDESSQIFGAGKIRAVLTNQGYEVSEKYVAELMREMGLHSIRSFSKREYLAQRRKHQKTNILQRNFNADVPDKVWVSDITYYKLKDNHYFICVFIDLCSRKVLSLSVGRNSSTNLVRAAFDVAVKNRKPTALTMHTDRGTPYTSYTMRNLARKHHIVQSFSHAGRPHDNAVVESFFASLKREEMYRARYKSEAEMKAALRNYVQFYNSMRPHSHLNYKTPDQYEAAMQNQSLEYSGNNRVAAKKS